MSTTVAKDVTLSLGLLTCTVSMLSAVEPKASNTNVCTGPDEAHKHEPTRIQSRNFCTTCDDFVAYANVKKGRPVGDGFVLLGQEDIQAAAGDAASLKKVAGLTAHPSADVDIRTTTGDKLYYLVPAAGSQKVYATLLALVQGHPELTLLARWTPKSAVGLFALKAFNGVLCFQGREAADKIRQAPEVDTTPDEKMLGLAEQLLKMEGVVEPFNPDTYADGYEDRLAAIIATKTPTTLITPAAPEATSVPAPTGATALDALQAMIDEAAAKAAPKPARKTRAKKAVA